jgi:O-antigen ligase
MLIALGSNFKFSLNSHVWFPLLAVILRLIPLTADFSYLILAGYALLGRRQIIEALLLSWLFSMLSPKIIPVAGYEGFFRYIIILACFFSILLRANFKKFHKLTFVTCGLGIFLILHAVFFSQVTTISFLKALNWTLVIVILFLAWKGMDSLEYENTKKWTKRFLLIILLFSIPTLLIPKIGFSVNSVYFSGILNHPQAFGMTAIALGALFIGQLSAQNKSTLLPFIITIICISLAIISGSRTAGLALLLAVIISFLLFPILTIRKIKSLFDFKKNKLLIGIIFFLLIIILGPFIFNLITIFITKTNKSTVDSIMDAFIKSRAILYEPMIYNILEHPLKGIGFGLASDFTNMDIKYFKGIPVSAPIEKGVLPLAMLEEVGVFGFIFFIIWILILVRYSIANGFSDTIVLLTILLFNLGEAGLFSPNGYGMLYLVLLASATTKPKLIKNTN